jgi:hypothetical protein
LSKPALINKIDPQPETPLASPPVIIVRRLSKRDLTINTNSPLNKKIELFKRKSTLKINTNTSESYKEDKNKDLMTLNTNKPLLAQEEELIQLEPNDLMTRSKRKKVTIRSPEEETEGTNDNIMESKKLRISQINDTKDGNNLIIPLLSPSHLNESASNNIKKSSFSPTHHHSALKLTEELNNGNTVKSFGEKILGLSPLLRYSLKANSNESIKFAKKEATTDNDNKISFDLDQNTQRTRSKTEYDNKTPTKILEKRDPVTEKSLPKINEIKEDDDIVTRTRSKTEMGRKSPKSSKIKVITRESISKRKFSAFRNKEINNIIESFQSPSLRPRKITNRKSTEKNLQKKLKNLEKTLTFIKEKVQKQANHNDFNENSTYIIQSQLGQINDYLKIACKRNKLIKKDPNFQGYFLKKNTFKVGDKVFANSLGLKPETTFHEETEMKFLTERLELQEVQDFPEPDEFLL